MIFITMGPFILKMGVPAQLSYIAISMLDFNLVHHLLPRDPPHVVFSINFSLFLMGLLGAFIAFQQGQDTRTSFLQRHTIAKQIVIIQAEREKAERDKAKAREVAAASRHGSIAGRARGGYSLRRGGTADANACRTVRRCTPCRTARSRTDTVGSVRRSRRIVSNSSTLDRCLTGTSTPTTVDVKTLTTGGANIRDDTPTRTTGHRDHQGGADIRDDQRPTRGQRR